MGFSGGSDIKNPFANTGGTGFIPGSGRSSRKGNGSPLQYSCLRNPMDRGAWAATDLCTEKEYTHKKRVLFCVRNYFLCKNIQIG